MPEFTYRLPWHRRLAFGIGHILNDLCAAMWFSYLLLYFHNVLNFSNTSAGYLLLIGQVADALATPLIGYESDNTNGFCKYTKRKSWHLLGTVCVLVAFPFLFMPCITCRFAAYWSQFIYYAPFVVIFQLGWASTQINHLSLIPELTPNEGERVELNAIRYAFTVCSNLAVYVIAWILLTNGNAGNSDTHLGADDIPHFRILALIVIAIGSFFSLMFHLFTKERRCDDRTQDFLYRMTLGANMIWKDWLKEFQFYAVALLYMCTRLVVNVSQIYLPMFVTDSLKLSKEYIALVPLAVYLSGFVTSFLMRPVNRIAGRKMTYLIGILLILGCCVWMFFLRHNSELEVFGAAILLGAGGSTMLVTSLSFTADLIGQRTESGAFVYGAMSFTDKLSNGIAVVVIQHLHPCVGSACCPACVWFYRDMIVFVPGGFACLALVLLIIMAPMKIGHFSRDGPSEGETTPLLGDSSSQDAEKSREIICCSYLCCATLSFTPDVHKAVLCNNCGQASCYQRQIQNSDNDHMHSYECINSMVKSGGRCAKSIQERPPIKNETRIESKDPTKRSSPDGKTELSSCNGTVEQGGDKDLHLCGADIDEENLESSYKKDKKGGKRSTKGSELKVCADVHA